MFIQATSSISDNNAGGKALQNIIPIIVWKIYKMLLLQLWRQMTDVPLNQKQGWVITHQGMLSYVTTCPCINKKIYTYVKPGRISLQRMGSGKERNLLKIACF